MTLLIKRHIALIFVILCVVCTIESRDRSTSGRRRDKITNNQYNLCEKDADMKLACHCTHDHLKQKINEVDCLVLHDEFSQSDPAWYAFNTHTNIKHFTLTVTSHGYMGYLPIDIFRKQRDLTSVIIRFGNIREIPSFAFSNLTRLQNISLQKNQIEVLNEHAFANHIELRVLDLEDNQIVNIHRFAFTNLQSLNELSLTKNNISTLDNELFVDLGNLNKLKLNENLLVSLTREIFKGLGKLQQLDLSYNSLKNLGDTVFAELWSLQELYLDSNHLERISERAFDGLNNLRILNLENNKIAVLEGGVFSGSPAVTTLNLNNNLLETLTYQNVLPIMDNLVNNTSSVLSISDNHFICECRLRWIFELKNNTKNYELRRSLERITCTQENSVDPFQMTYKTISRHNPPRHNNDMDLHYNGNDNHVDNNIDARARVVKEVVELFSIDPNQLRCEQIAEPTELPLQRESAVMDFTKLFKSSATSRNIGSITLNMILLAISAIIIVS